MRLRTQVQFAWEIGSLCSTAKSATRTKKIRPVAKKESAKGKTRLQVKRSSCSTWLKISQRNTISPNRSLKKRRNYGRATKPTHRKPSHPRRGQRWSEARPPVPEAL